ncbi:MAG: WYL domain-containing transcriptional regulator [Ignavibacteriae bacterium]|nr:WYL domain-containing transcriptional regulator [Ignavibacteriota bacterium]
MGKINNIINEEYTRQIEFAAMVLAKPREYTELDIIEHFKVSPQTIRRDAEKLRNMGIDIHSSKKKYEVTGCTNDTLNHLICTYLALNKYDIIKNLKLIKGKYRDETLLIFVNILKAIDKKHMIEIIYRKNKDGGFRKEITPISLSRTNRNVYLIAMDNDEEDKTRVFLLDKIDDIRFLNKISKVKKYPNTFSLFKTSWGIYSGGEECDVSLKFSSETGRSIKNKFYIETQKIIEKPDYYLMNMRVKLSLEFVSWVMGWGDGVEVVKPQELKDMIVERAAKIVKLYKKK